MNQEEPLLALIDHYNSEVTPFGPFSHAPCSRIGINFLSWLAAMRLQRHSSRYFAMACRTHQIGDKANIRSRRHMGIEGKLKPSSRGGSSDHATCHLFESKGLMARLAINGPTPS